MATDKDPYEGLEKIRELTKTYTMEPWEAEQLLKLANQVEKMRDVLRWYAGYQSVEGRLDDNGDRAVAVLKELGFIPHNDLLT